MRFLFQRLRRSFISVVSSSHAAYGWSSELPMANGSGERDQKALQFIENVTSNADQVQSQVLSEILSANAHTHYLTHFPLNGRTDRSSFKKCLPVITYEDVEEDILRIANGDTSPILSANPISEFLTSSGTSGGEWKLIPMTEEELERRNYLNNLIMPVVNQYLKGLDKGKGMYFLFIKEEAKTPGGLSERPALTSFYKSKYFRESLHDTYNVYTSPVETILCLDGDQSMYSQLLCGLLHTNDVLRVGSVFPPALIRAMRFLEEHWREMCRDIATGTLNEEAFSWDPFVREAVTARLLHPNPELAENVERECSQQSWKGIISRLWPNTKYINTVVTGAMAQYIPTLDYYSDCLPLVCSWYGSSECYMGINLQPFCEPSQVSYTLLPNFAYFEFLPVNTCTDPAPTSNNNGAEQAGDLIDLVDVKIGQEYEIVVTTYAGLYRYRVGDVLRVTGFHNAAPQFRFVRRKNVVLSVDSDKTDESSFGMQWRRVRSILGGILTDYTSHADISTIPAHYVLFWELHFDDNSNAVPPTSIMEECCLTIEQSLNSVYRQCRVSDKSIGPLEIRVVERGTLDELMDCAIKRGASMTQYKTPTCVKLPLFVDLLNSRVTATFWSRKLPEWRPDAINVTFNTTKNNRRLLSTWMIIEI
eukprot:Gb_09255 [translate_table: standard]